MTQEEAKRAAILGATDAIKEGAQVIDNLIQLCKIREQPIDTLSKALGDALELLGRCSEQDIDHGEIAPLWAILEKTEYVSE